MLYSLARSTCFAQKDLYALLSLPQIVVILSLLFKAFIFNRRTARFPSLFLMIVLQLKPIPQIKVVKQKQHSVSIQILVDWTASHY